jgi:hypothetical protein
MDQVRGSDKPSSSTPKVERRLVEKNRRNQMKILYSKLNSLLPNYNPKVLISLSSSCKSKIHWLVTNLLFRFIEN